MTHNDIKVMCMLIIVNWYWRIWIFLLARKGYSHQNQVSMHNDITTFLWCIALVAAFHGRNGVSLVIDVQSLKTDIDAVRK